MLVGVAPPADTPLVSEPAPPGCSTELFKSPKSVAFQS